MNNTLISLYNGFLEYSLVRNVYDPLINEEFDNLYCYPGDVKIKILGQHYYQAIESFIKYLLFKNNCSTKVNNHDLNLMYNDLPENIKRNLNIKLPSKEFYNGLRFFGYLQNQYISKLPYIENFEPEDIKNLESLEKILDYIKFNYNEDYNNVLKLVKYN